ncbi:uncharacterized protein LOC123545408 [Mercenaria mercenaria]|uniref:uncharacterized protein LOC123545408 n=1 Tax=Mercenaria mercenaria TaxID=6596 RepID=UPI00234F6ADB|nr:uncharacterized protein LOC123545408 [Mercenaria mercenaria]
MYRESVYKHFLAIFSICNSKDSASMMNAVILLLCVTVVSTGFAFPGNFDERMRYRNGNNIGRFYSQQYRNKFPDNEYFNGCGRRESEFGNDAWYFLHTLAANYPENPSSEQQANMMDMMRIFAEFYPHPNSYFRRSGYAQSDTSNRENFSQWMCMLHNNVNQQMGKPEFDCSTVLDVWTNECYQNSGESCDPGRSEFGRATWNLMHTYAFTYPENPSPMQQEDMRRFMYQIAEFYPSTNFYYITSLFNDEPDTTDRESFMNWMCRAHNYVNARRGKPEFDCNEVWDHWQYRGCEY